MWPNSAPLQDIRLRNLGDLEFDLYRLLKVKCDDVIGLAIRSVVLIYAVITGPTPTRLALMATQNVFSSLSPWLGPNYENSKVHRMTPKWHWRLKGQRYPIYVEPTSLKFQSIVFYDRLIVFQITEGFDFSIAWATRVNLEFSKKNS